MLLANNDGTFQAGPADFICILKLPAGTFHVAFFEEYPMPGRIEPINELKLLRFKSKMHHTTGAETLEEARVHSEELRKHIKLPDENVVLDEAVEVENPVSVMLLLNWTRGDGTLKESLFKR